MSVSLFYSCLKLWLLILLAEVIYNWRSDRRFGKPRGSHERSKCDNTASVWMLISDSGCETTISLISPNRVLTHSNERTMWHNRLTIEQSSISLALSCFWIVLKLQTTEFSRWIVDLWPLMAAAQSCRGLWFCMDYFYCHLKLVMNWRAVTVFGFKIYYGCCWFYGQKLPVTPIH